MLKKAWLTTMAVMGAVIALGTTTAAAWAQGEHKGLSAMDKQFIRKVAQTNIAEVKVGKLALQKSKSERVRMIANMLVKEHSMANDALKPIAKSHNVAFPKDTDRAHKAMYNRLARMSGSAFDMAFMKGQVKGHNATLALFRKEMDRGRDSHVREYAAQFIVNIQNHTQHIHNVASNLGIRVASESSQMSMNPAMAR